MRPVPLRAARSSRQARLPASRAHRSPPTRSRRSTPTGAPPTTSRSARSTCYDNPLLEAPLQLEHIKPRLLGHWGTTPGLNFIYAHLNRVDRRARPVRCCSSPVRGTADRRSSPTRISKARTASSIPTLTQDEDGMRRLFKQFSFPGGIPSHVARGNAGLDPRRRRARLRARRTRTARRSTIPISLVACVIGDGEAETGPLAASWQSNKFLNPERDGAVLPILHLNGYKIAGPTVLARIPRDELEAYLRRLRLRALLRRRRRSGDDAPARWRRRSIASLADIRTIQHDAREHAASARGRAGR